MDYEFNAKLWEWRGQGAWCFVSLPAEYYDEIRLVANSPRRGFGSQKVEVTIGKSVWRTSIFPESKTNTYILPVKKEIRIKERITVGAEITVGVRLVGV